MSVGAALLASASFPAPLHSVNCNSAQGYVIGWDLVPGDSDTSQLCSFDSFRCEQAKQPQPPFVQKVNPNCDPEVQACTVRIHVDLEFPGNEQNWSQYGQGAPAPWVYWFLGGQPPAGCQPSGSTCGEVGLCGVFPSSAISLDFIRTWAQGSASCSDLDDARLTLYSVSAFTCPTAACEERLDVPDLSLQPWEVAGVLGCRAPPKRSCPNDNSCTSCRRVGPGGMGVGGGGGGAGPPGSGPDGGFGYTAGGGGGPGLPGSAIRGFDSPAERALAVRSTGGLGRYWIHPWAERLVIDPDASRVWLLTRHATFREFTDPDAGGLYQTASPSDEYRQLTEVAPGSGWELRSLDGTVQSFDASGRWSGTVDRNGNATMPTYTGGALTDVAMPDGRSLTFTYDAGTGKLETITEVGVDTVTTRTWTYAWSGEDLAQIDRPDGTSYRFTYGDARFPGYLTLIELLGNDGPPRSERVELGYEYDAEGNAVKIWRGATAPSDPGAVDVWSLSFDNPVYPTETTVTDPLGGVSTVTFQRDPGRPGGGPLLGSRKPRVTRIEGDCPGCGLGPNSQLSYGDPVNPLRPTQEVDGEGHITAWTYAGNGQVETRSEAVGTALERTTSYLYDAAYPALVELISRPSVKAGEMRETMFVRDGSGNAEQRIESGVEDTAAGDDTPFSYSTLTTFNPAGQPLTVDPPGHGTADQTTFTYAAARGDLLPETRADPLIGVTTFAYDPFNRRVTVTDPNGVPSHTAFDALDRVTESRQEGAASPAEDLATAYEYTPIGDLFRTTLPRGNVIEYDYDAAGRLTTITRKPDAMPPGAANTAERTVYQLDAAGNRTREEQQRWDGAGWVTETATDYLFHTRCQLDEVIQAPGTPEEAVTEYRYDCNGNLAQVWDANHASAADPPTQVYTFDELDRLETVTQPWGGAGGGSAVTAYGYDVQNHLTAVTDAEGNLTTYEYSDRDLLTEEISPVSGTTTHLYDEHGELTETTDARGVTVLRTVDALDRVTFVDYPEPAQGVPSLDTTYTYDDPAVAFSLGRLTAINRHGQSVNYEYDRFGRVTRDGDLTYQHDANGNRSQIGYHSGVNAVYTHDFADRQQTLTIQRPGLPDQPLVTAAEYMPAGPLTDLTLGNGLTETRSFDQRYAPQGIDVTDPAGPTILFDWDYTGDGVGNPTAITDALAPANNRTYGYQDIQYYLTQGDGPWGALGWTYDRIGNRLTDTRDGLTDTYSYLQNPSTGNSAVLDEIQLGVGGTHAYTYGPAGHLEAIHAAGNLTLHSWDAEGRLSHLQQALADAGSQLFYDGRSFLDEARQGPALGPGELFSDNFESGDTCQWAISVGESPPRSCPPAPAHRTTNPVYSSDGLLYGYTATTAPESAHVFYFAGRPVGQLEVSGGSESWKLLTTDHLGTPVLAIDLVGTVAWEGGFEPFGADHSGAEAAGVFLRFPGQWVDGGWGAEPQNVYNLQRWYSIRTGRYLRPDPLFFTLQDVNPYVYVGANPSVNIDPMGLQTFHCTRPLGRPPGPRTPPPIANHQYACILEEDGTYTCDSTSAQVEAPWFGPDVQPGTGGNERDQFHDQRCREIEPRNHCFEDCLREQWSQPRRTYAVGWRGEDCQEYTDRVIVACRIRCNPLSLSIRLPGD